MHYVADQQGIIERYLKEAESWASHLENTKRAIIESAENKKKDNCAILGSGWLLDVPIEYLCQHFKKVYLFDVVHPTQIKHKMSKIKNVELIEHDITGGAINEFYDSVQTFKSFKKRKEPDEFKFNGFGFNISFDYVVSVNILNQLDILLIDYIKTYDLYSAEELMNFRKSIQQKHINSLPNGKSFLVTDFEELVFNKDSISEKTNSLVHIQLPLDRIKAQWQWQFDHQDYIPGKNVVFNVLAFDL